MNEKYWVAYGVQTLPINVSTINSKWMHVLCIIQILKNKIEY